MFRVKAENIHGQSKPLVTQDSTKAVNPFSKSAESALHWTVYAEAPLLVLQNNSSDW